MYFWITTSGNFNNFTLEVSLFRWAEFSFRGSHCDWNVLIISLSQCFFFASLLTSNFFVSAARLLNGLLSYWLLLRVLAQACPAMIIYKSRLLFICLTWYNWNSWYRLSATWSALSLSFLFAPWVQKFSTRYTACGGTYFSGGIFFLKTIKFMPSNRIFYKLFQKISLW